MMFPKTDRGGPGGEGGFTLLELLLVLLIMGTTLALSIGAWGVHDSPLESES